MKFFYSVASMFELDSKLRNNESDDDLLMHSVDWLLHLYPLGLQENIIKIYMIIS